MRREVHPLPSRYYEQRAESIKLVKGVVEYVQIGLARGYKVLCPTLSKGFGCEKGKFRRKKEEWYRPRFLVKNCGDPRLQLWVCPGCESKFLLRVHIDDGLGC